MHSHVILFALQRGAALGAMFLRCLRRTHAVCASFNMTRDASARHAHAGLSTAEWWCIPF